MKTPLNKLREEIIKTLDYIEGLDDEFSNGQRITYEIILEKIEELIDEEMKPFSQRLNQFILDWFESNKNLFTVYESSQFVLEDTQETFLRFKRHYENTTE